MKLHHVHQIIGLRGLKSCLKHPVINGRHHGNIMGQQSVINSQARSAWQRVGGSTSVHGAGGVEIVCLRTYVLQITQEVSRQLSAVSCHLSAVSCQRCGGGQKCVAAGAAARTESARGAQRQQAGSAASGAAASSWRVDDVELYESPDDRTLACDSGVPATTPPVRNIITSFCYISIYLYINESIFSLVRHNLITTLPILLFFFFKCFLILYRKLLRNENL